MCRWCSSAIACDITAQPPARTRAVAWRRFPSTIWLAGSSGEDARGGAITQMRRSPPVEQPAAVDAHRAHARQALRACAWSVGVKRRGLQQVVGAGGRYPHVGERVHVVRGVFQAVQQIAVGGLDRDAAEHRDRAGRRDRDRARAPRAQLHHRDVRDRAGDRSAPGAARARASRPAAAAAAAAARRRGAPCR